MLRTKYGLTGNDPYRFVVYEREFPLSGELKGALAKGNYHASAISVQPESPSCKLKADG
jgi:hypothetical protein